MMQHLKSKSAQKLLLLHVFCFLLLIGILMTLPAWAKAESSELVRVYEQSDIDCENPQYEEVELPVKEIEDGPKVQSRILYICSKGATVDVTLHASAYGNGSTTTAYLKLKECAIPGECDDFEMIFPDRESCGVKCDLKDQYYHGTVHLPPGKYEMKLSAGYVDDSYCKWNNCAPSPYRKFFFNIEEITAEEEITVLETELNSKLPETSWQFSFVQLTDLHIGEGEEVEDYGSFGFDDIPPDHDLSRPARNLRSAVNWINDNVSRYKIKFVVVTGDITDSAERSEFIQAKYLLDKLKVPYIPIIGNHDLWPYTKGRYGMEASYPFGDEFFKEVFFMQFNKLRKVLPGWNDGTRLTGVWNPECQDGAGCVSYLQNYTFTYAGYLFVFADFGARLHAKYGMLGALPEAELMDFIGGTWPWFKDTIDQYPYKAADNVLVFSHHPLYPYPIIGEISSFSRAEYTKVTNYLNHDSYNYYSGLWLAGHFHRNMKYYISYYGMNIVCPGIITKALKEDNGYLRVVKVFGKTNEPNPSGVVLYNDINYRGKGEFFPKDDSDLGDNFIGDSEASSHRIKGLKAFYLYEKPEFQGLGIIWDTDCPNYKELGIDDWASSLSIDIPPTPWATDVAD